MKHFKGKVRQFIISTILIVVLVFASIHPVHAIEVFFDAIILKTDSTASLNIHMKIPLGSVQFKKLENNNYQASVQIKVMCFLGNKLVAFDNYIIDSPEFADSNNQKALLTSKDYTIPQADSLKLAIQFIDLNQPDNSIMLSQILSSKFSKNKIEFSNILLADTIFRNKQMDHMQQKPLNMVPNVFRQFAVGKKQIQFYTELYNTPNIIKQDHFYLRYKIFKNEKLISGEDNIKKVKTNNNIIIADKINSENFDTGNYRLSIELVSLQNQVLSSKDIDFKIVSIPKISMHEYFTRQVAGYTLSQLKDYLDYLIYEADKDELQKVELLVKETDSLAMQQFFVHFWMQRDSLQPGKTWRNYLQKINKANQLFTTSLRKGYLTDRGRVYIQYGPPNQVAESSISGISYPYQIWHYYQLADHQTNKRFIFFNKTGALEEFELLHSDATGEPKNLNWKKIIQKYNKSESSIFGDFLDEDFKQ